MNDRSHREPERERGLSTADLATVTEEPPRYAEERHEERGHGQAASHPRSGTAEHERPVALLADQETQEFRSRWEALQIGFVDSPRESVEKADGLVAELMRHLAESFARERQNLEDQWTRGENVSTEDLRLALRRYRSFFDRLLSI